MFYSIALRVLSDSHPTDESTKAKVRSNLWLSFNDVRLLLDPSSSSIQALIILASYVEEFMTPSICWSLISKACTMLQALGFTQWRLDSATRERRIILFWRLNILDKALALVMCRPPTYHREMSNEISLPTLDQLSLSHHRSASNDVPAIFNAHSTHQMHLLSQIMADAWHCLYGQTSDDVGAVIERLESWYHQATEVAGSSSYAFRGKANGFPRFLRLLRLQRNLSSQPGV